MQVVGSITHHSTHLKAFLQREDRQVHCEKMLLWEYFCVFINKAYVGFPGGSDHKESACNAGDTSSIPESGRSPGEGNGNPLLPGEFHGQRSLVGYSPWGCKESDMTEQLN